MTRNSLHKQSQGVKVRPPTSGTFRFPSPGSHLLLTSSGRKPSDQKPTGNLSSVGPKPFPGLVLEPEPVICSPVCLRSADGPSETMGHRGPVTDQTWPRRARRPRRACRPHRPRRACRNCRSDRLHCTHRDNSFNENRSGKAWCDSVAAEQVGLPAEVNSKGHRVSISLQLLAPRRSGYTSYIYTVKPKQRFEHGGKSFCCYTERQTEHRDNKQQKKESESLIFHVMNQPHCCHVLLHVAGRRCVRRCVCPAGEGDDSDIITWRALEGTIVVLLRPLCTTHTCTDFWLDSEGEKESQCWEVEPSVWFSFLHLLSLTKSFEKSLN